MIVCHGHVEVVEDFDCDLLEEINIGELPCAEVHTSELGVVIEHLLEMGDDPLGIDGVPGEASEEVVVDATLRHCGELTDEHVEAVLCCVGARQERRSS